MIYYNAKTHPHFEIKKGDWILFRSKGPWALYSPKWYIRKLNTNPEDLSYMRSYVKIAFRPFKLYLSMPIKYLIKLYFSDRKIYG